MHRGRLHDWVSYLWYDADDSMYVTIALPSQTAVGVTIPVHVFGQLVNVARAYDFSTELPEHTIQKYAGDSQLLLKTYICDYIQYDHELDVLHRGTGFKLGIKPVASKCGCPLCHEDKQVGDEVHYKLVGEHPTGNEKTTVTVVAPSVFEPSAKANAYAPVRDRECAKEAQTLRIVRVNQVAEQQVAPTAAEVRARFPEFIKSLRKQLHLKDPTADWIEQVRACYREVMTLAANQPLADTPLTEKSGDMEPGLRESRGFLKAESLGERKVPRIICPINPKIQSRLYPFTQSLQDAMHGAPWFAFGVGPEEVAYNVCRLSHIAMDKQTCLLETDYSKFDGTINSLMRELELMIYQECFPEHKELLAKLHSYTSYVDQRVNGSRCNTRYSRASGVADTCLMNSLLNIFAWWLTLGDECFRLCIVGGDDGLAVVGSDTAFVENATKCGFSVKCKLVRPGETFSFLARIYNWGSPNSCCDVLRMTAKIHILGEPNVPEKYRPFRFRQKLLALLRMDANTPVVGEILRDLVRGLQDKKIPEPKRMAELTYIEKWLSISNYPNVCEPWMRDYVARFVHLLKKGDQILLEDVSLR